MINICSCSVSEHLYVIIFGVFFRRGLYCYFCANGFQSLTEKTLHRSTLLHTRLHIFHSSESYWLGYVNSPATRPTTNLHFSDFISKAVQQCIDKYIKFITKRNCNMFPRKEACPYHLWHSKWSYCLHPDGYIQHLWGDHSTVSSSLHSCQLN